MPTNNLEVLRKDKRKTIRDVAAETKIGQTAVWKMENGLQGISVVYAITLAKYYGVTTDFLFGISDLKNGIKETIVYKDRDITYQAVLETINKFSKDDLLKLSGAVDNALRRKSELNSSQSESKPLFDDKKHNNA